MSYKSMLLLSLLSVFSSGCHTPEIEKIICTSVGKAGLQVFKKLITALAIKAPNAEFTYAHPLLTVKHGDVLKDADKATLPQESYWYTLMIDSHPDSTTTVMRFEHISQRKK